MMIYQPTVDSLDRVVWHGGESTQLYYEKLSHGKWLERDVQTLGSGLPKGMSEMQAEMVEYYQLSQLLEQERTKQLM
jgi:hypothetical protein